MSELFSNIQTIDKRLASLEGKRKDNGENVISLGIPFLDAAFRGISRTDLVLLGAGSGAGKSEAAAHIAFHNARMKRKVLMIAIEAEDGEIEQRQMYKIFAQKFYADLGHDRSVYMNFTDFYFGRLNKVYDRYREECEEEFLKASTLMTRYTEKSYNMESLMLDIENAKDVDLIILDHLHYMDIEGSNDNKAFKKALQDIRSANIAKKIPIIVVSQLRKDMGHSNGSVMPDISDFYGSSDIFKTATKAIMFASAGDIIQAGKSAIRKPTLVRAVKNRIDGSVKFLTGLMVYNVSMNSYEDGFTAGNLVWERDELTKMRVERFITSTGDDLPRWAEEGAQAWQNTRVTI